MVSAYLQQFVESGKMGSAMIWTLVLFGGACYAATVPSRIVGGSPTSIAEYPSVVQVEFLGSFTGIWSQSCAGTILTTQHVLSAAHCFVGNLYAPENRRVRAGSTFRNTGGQVVMLASENNHPSYGQLGYDGDITVVKLAEALVFNPVVQPTTIVAQGSQLPDNLPVVHAGWGAVTQGGPLSPELLDVTIYTVNNQLCAERYLTLPNPGLVTENMICAGILDVGGKDACQGDSGGPLYYGEIQVGIVSWGHGCANATFPGVSTAVSPYTDWIISTAV